MPKETNNMDTFLKVLQDLLTHGLIAGAKAFVNTESVEDSLDEALSEIQRQRAQKKFPEYRED